MKRFISLVVHSRITQVCCLALLLLLTGIVIVRAEGRTWHGWCGRRWHHFGPAGYLAHELKLSHDQKTQIHALWDEERPALSAHLRELIAENEEMDAISAKDHPDPQEVEKIADREGKTIAAMLVEKASLESKIEATVLNPQQRAKAEELRKKWESRLSRVADHLETQPAEK